MRGDTVRRAIIDALAEKAGYGNAQIEAALSEMMDDVADDKVAELQKELDALKGEFTKLKKSVEDHFFSHPGRNF